MWTSSTVKSARPNDAGTWEVVVARDGAERSFTVKHVVFATGLGAGEGKLPSYPGMVRMFISALGHCFISFHFDAGHLQGPDPALDAAQACYGSCGEEGRRSWRLYFRCVHAPAPSLLPPPPLAFLIAYDLYTAHDICVDYYEHGVGAFLPPDPCSFLPSHIHPSSVHSSSFSNSLDITMYQRSSTYVLTTKNGWNRIMKPVYWEGGPPVDVADRLTASFPHLVAVPLNQRQVRLIAEDDKCVG